jgi:hypothetical protein
MSTIVGAEGLRISDVFREIGDGARFVVYQFCISVFIMSFRNSSAIHFVRPGERYLGPALGMSGVSLVAGWWGIPWGPIWTVSTIASNLSGGKDVTEEVMHALSAYPEDFQLGRGGALTDLEGVFE